MAVHVHHSEGGTSYGVVHCDAPECPVQQPPVAELLAAGGLIALGWHCKGGAHFCPDHHPEEKTK
jgi:hypothetical protein